MKAGIAIEKWKLSIFEAQLTEAGYDYEEKPGPRPDILMLMVETEDLPKLAEVVHATNTKCKHSRMH